MKRLYPHFLFSLFLPFILIMASGQAFSQPQLDYYLPDSVSYDPNIPTPASVLGHAVGEYHVTHDRLVAYMHVLDKASDRITLDTMGHTHEGRPLVLLTITMPENHHRINEIRKQHRLLTDPAQSAGLNTADMPAVFYMGFSIHGNEPSGSNASLLVAYYLAAAKGTVVENQLRNTVILLDPSFNPDGLQRFASWANSRRSKLISADPNDMEHHEPWPGGRTNHYWFDLNRDWLVAQHPESQARVRKFHDWKPNVLTDHHEMGTNQTFFFQPGVPSRTHPLTPAANMELTKKMGEFHARALDGIGSLYFTQESFDDFYYGKGSTFPDVQGAVGILFEQGSSRGHAQESENGIVTFPFTIRNQFTAALSSLRFVEVHRIDLLNHQRRFFADALDRSRKDATSALIFGSSRDKGSAFHLAEIVARQDIAVYRPAASQTINGKTFGPDDSYVIPLNQSQYTLIKSMFETRTEFQDSLFYDISAWTLSLAAGVDIEALRSVPRLGERVTTPRLPAGRLVGNHDAYAYAFETFGYYAPRAIYRLLDAGVRVKVATEPFYHPDGKSFARGSIMIPVHGQPLGPDSLQAIVRQIAREDGIDLYSFQTGLDYRGVSLGSATFRPLRKPSIAILVGDGVSAYDAGELWHLLDTRFEIPVTMLPLDVLQRADLSRYNTIILPQGSYGSVAEGTRDKLKTWLRAGGVLIGFENALSWLHTHGFGKFTMKTFQEKDTASPPITRPYAEMNDARGAQATNGAIFEAQVDLTHPLLYGYHRERMPLFKGNNFFMEPSDNPYANPIRFTEKPLLAGYISKRNQARIPGASMAGVSAHGPGRVIGFTENVAFRAFWFGTNKLLMNGIFYGQHIHAGGSR